MISVAIDFQGVDKARPFVEQAGATFPTVIDAENQLGLLFGFKAIPNAIFVDEVGIIRYTQFSGFDIRQPQYRQLTEGFATSPDLTALAAETRAGSGFESDAASNHFRRGLAYYRSGDTQAALHEWRAGAALEPDNWIFRKQVWAIEHPERFYAGDVDFDWQKEQIAQDR